MDRPQSSPWREVKSCDRLFTCLPIPCSSEVVDLPTVLDASSKIKIEAAVGAEDVCDGTTQDSQLSGWTRMGA